MSVFTFNTTFNTVSLPAPLSRPAVLTGGTVRGRAFLAQVLRRLADSPLDSPALRTMQPAAPRATTHRQQVRLSAEWHTVIDANGAGHLEAAWHTEN